MTRIATYGASQMYLQRITDIQQRVSNLQVQVTTEKKSVNYTGISRETNQLVNVENEKARAQQYIDNNATAQIRLSAATVAMDAIEKTVKDFRDQLQDFHALSTTNEKEVTAIQEWAFRAMQDMQSYLAASVDGKYIFAGGRVSEEPVQLPASTLSGFQSIYDGNDHTYPTTRTAHLLELSTTNAATGNLTFSAAAGTITAATAGSLSNIPVGSRVTVAGAAANNNNAYTVVANTGTQIKVSRLTTETTAAATVAFGTTSLTSANTGNLTFAPGADTITAATAGSLSGLAVGTTFTVSGTGSNDGVYEVASNTGTAITIRSTKVGTTETVAATLSSDSWYSGDTMTLQHRVDDDRIIDVGIYASDPAFEKAMRAMGLIAQGTYGSAGGLENNMDRIEQALFLLKDSLKSPAGPNPPFGTERTGDLTSLQADTGFMQALIKTKDDKHKQYMGFLDQRIIQLENVDKTEALTMLLDDQRALEVSYNALARVREMSLINFMK